MIENAQLQLSYTEIRAPIDGRTGNVLIHQGNVVKANDVGNPLVVINRIHPIYVAFAVPEQFLDRIKRYRAAGELAVEATTQGPSERTARGELLVRQQHRRHHDGHDPAQGDVPEHGQRALAGPVRRTSC